MGLTFRQQVNRNRLADRVEQGLGIRDWKPHSHWSIHAQSWRLTTERPARLGWPLSIAIVFVSSVACTNSSAHAHSETAKPAVLFGNVRPSAANEGK